MTPSADSRFREGEDKDRAELARFPERRHGIKRGRPRGRREEPREDEDDEGRRELVDKIEGLRVRRGLSQKQLETEAKLPRVRLSKWKDSGEPSARQLDRIAKVLGESIHYFLGESAAPMPGRPTPDSDTALAYALVDKLGPERAIRRLLLNDGDRAAHRNNRPSAEPR